MPATPPHTIRLVTSVVTILAAVTRLCKSDLPSFDDGEDIVIVSRYLSERQLGDVHKLLSLYREG